jgi:hypothetical protein
VRGAINPFPQYAFMAWCSVKEKGNLPLALPLLLKEDFEKRFGKESLSRR